MRQYIEILNFLSKVFPYAYEKPIYATIHRIQVEFSSFKKPF